MTNELSKLKEDIQKERHSRLETEDTNAEFFCSHTVAVVLKAMGVLPQTVPSTEYLPYSFSSEVGLPLLRGATFSKEVFLRGTHESSLCSVGGYSAEVLAEAIQKVIESGGKVTEKVSEEDGSEKDVKEVKEGDDPKKEREEVAPKQTSQDIPSLITPDDLKYLHTQLRLTRTLGRASPASIDSLLRSMKLSLLFLNLIRRTFYLPGDVLQLFSADMTLCALLRGDVHFNQWTESLGEELVERRGTMSLLGVAAHPSDGQELARITADDVAAIACVSSSTVQAVSKEAPGIHKLERFRLIRSMKRHPLFQNLSYKDLYRFSYYFYKVQLEQGDMLGREGYNPSFLYYIDTGSIKREEKEKRGWKESQRILRGGSFPCLSSLVMNQPCDATYTVAEDHTTVYVCNPSVLQYFTGSRFLGMEVILMQLRDPSADAAVALMKETVEGLRFYKTGDSVDRMHDGFEGVKSEKEPDMIVDEALEKRVHTFVTLLQRVFVEEVKEVKEHKEGSEYVASAGVQLLQTLQIPSVVNWIYEAVAPLFREDESEGDKIVTDTVNTDPPVSETTSDPSSNTSQNTPPSVSPDTKALNTVATPLVDEEHINYALSQYLHRNNLNDYTNEQILSVLMAFRYDSPSDSAAYLLFLLLGGISEPCMIPRDEFEKQAKLAGILTEENRNQLIDFFFHSKNTIDYDDYWTLLHSSSIPSSIQLYLSNLTSLVTQIIPCQHVFLSTQHQVLRAYRNADQNAILKVHSPFHLLAFPFPVPYQMTFAIRQESFSADYWKYVIGGFLGELFVGYRGDHHK